MAGTLLMEKTWDEAAKLLSENPVIVLPIGGGVKEHGHHLPLGTDKFVIDDLASRLLQTVDQHVLILPTLNYGYFPAFVSWPGSVSISAENFIRFVGDIVRSYARHGARRFLILDGGISTQPPLAILSYDLHNELGVHVAVTNIAALAEETQDAVCETKEGGHGDESETSCMLAVRPDLVRLERAKPETGTALPNMRSASGSMRIVLKSHMRTATGIVGDPRPATSVKGEKILVAMAAAVAAFIKTFDVELS